MKRRLRYGARRHFLSKHLLNNCLLYVITDKLQNKTSTSFAFLKLCTMRQSERAHLELFIQKPRWSSIFSLQDKHFLPRILLSLTGSEVILTSSLRNHGIHTDNCQLSCSKEAAQNSIRQFINLHGKIQMFINPNSQVILNFPKMNY